MKKLGKKDINADTYSVFSGTDIKWAKAQGFKEVDLEQSYNGNWYEIGKAPIKSQDEINKDKISELELELDGELVTRKIKNSWYRDSKDPNEAKKYQDIELEINTRREDILKEIRLLRGI